MKSKLTKDQLLTRIKYIDNIEERLRLSSFVHQISERYYGQAWHEINLAIAKYKELASRRQLG